MHGICPLSLQKTNDVMTSAFYLRQLATAALICCENADFVKSSVCGIFPIRIGSFLLTGPEDCLHNFVVQ